MPSAVTKQTYAPASRKLAPGRSSRWFSSRAMVTENRPSKNSSSAKMPKSDSDGIARSGATALVVLAIQRQSSHAPPRFEQEQQHGKAGHEKFLELLAGAARRENLRLLRFKQRGIAPGAGEFLDLQFFQPFVFLQPHLEPARERHEHAEAEENRARLPGQRIHVASARRTRR